MVGKKAVFLVLPLLLILGACKEKEELRVMTWTDYVRGEVIQDFEKETGKKIVLDYFSSNEELLAKVQASLEAKGRGYDLILPSDYMVQSMIRLDLLQPIDKSKLSFLGDLDALLKKPSYDPKLERSVPFAWGTTGLAVNTKLVKVDLSKGLSWKEVLENPAFKGQVTLLDDMREVAQIGLLILGKNWATATEDDVRAAFAYLKKNKGNVKIFTPEARPVVQHAECGLCQAYSGDVHQIATGMPEVHYVIPKEGATLWADNFAIPKNATHVELAYVFLNKVLSPEGARRFTNSTFYPTSNAKTRELVYPQIRDNPGIFPGAPVMARLSFIPERPELLKVMDRLWTELKSE